MTDQPGTPPPRGRDTPKDAAGKSAPAKPAAGKAAARDELLAKDAARTPAAPAEGHPLLTSLGAAVRARRQSLGWTRQVLADQSGLSLRFLAEVESGQSNVSVLKLADLAQALKVPLPSLLSSAGARSEESGRGRVVALVGLRGAGKSTLGPLLATRLDMPFVELDALVQDGTGLALAELFELHGESYYRRAEREALERVVTSAKPRLVAASGGIVTDPQSLSLLRERTLMVWLRARPELHIPRLEAQGDRRPMANRPNALAQLQGLLRIRTPLYRQARLHFDTSVEGPAVCADRLAAEIRRVLAERA